MMKLARAVLTGAVLSFALAGVALAADKAAAAAPSHKPGEKVYVCGCGEACECGTLKASGGKCHCGKDLVEGTITKVASGSVTVKTAKGDVVVKNK